MPLRVVEVTELGDHASAWDAAVDALPLPSPFLRSWWLTAIAGRRAGFVLALDGDTCVGGLALARRRIAGVELVVLLGSRTPLCPDHLELVSAAGRTAEVGAAIRQWALRGNRVYLFDGLVEGSELARILPHARTSELDQAPCAPLPATAEQHLAARPRSFRKTVRRARNRFAELGATVRPVGADGLDGALDDFAAMHRARGDREELLACLPRLRAALAAGVARDEAWVDVLASDDTVFGVSIAFAVAGRVSLYQTARTADADNAGTVLNLAAIERAVERGFGEVDLLRGAEDYKRHYAEGTRTLVRVTAAHGPLGRGALLALTALTAARRWVSRAPRAWAGGSGS